MLGVVDCCATSHNRTLSLQCYRTNCRIALWGVPVVFACFTFFVSMYTVYSRAQEQHARCLLWVEHSRATGAEARPGVGNESEGLGWIGIMGSDKYKDV